MKRFIGTWNLITYHMLNPDGERVDLLGENPRGRLMYDPAGYMSVQIINPDRPLFASRDPFEAMPDEIRAAFQGLSTYFGRYEVHEDQVIHHIEMSSFPNWAGTQQVRFFEFRESLLPPGKGTRYLILKTPPIVANNIPLTRVITWEKLA